MIGLFNQKLKRFTQGRKTTFEQLQNAIKEEDKTIWMHVASLGEFEQGLPILDELRSAYAAHIIVLTFFSPSGYEVKKNTSSADVVTYLPMDTGSNAKKFLDIVKPEIALFVKYEIWPNYLYALQQRKIPTFLISAIFRKNQIYFKWYGGFMRRALEPFNQFFVQNTRSKELLQSIGFENIHISGDTRFDRVGKILSTNASLDFMEQFKGQQLCIVSGSTWPQDEEILVDFTNASSKNTKFVIAPHDIKPKHIQKLKSSIDKKTVLFSEREKTSIQNAAVLIIDTVGLLTKIYSYADIAYVGGGFATGLHNTLEPAVYGIPVLIGPDYEGFQEVEDLVGLGGVMAIKNSKEFNERMQDLLEDAVERKHLGKVNSDYIDKNRGATTKVIAYIKDFL